MTSSNRLNLRKEPLQDRPRNAGGEQNVTDVSSGRSLHENTGGGPLGIIVNPSGNPNITAGESLDLSITVSNNGPIGAIIDIYIDESSALVEWCSERSWDRLALNPRQSSEVVFHIEVPIDTGQGNYPYTIIIDAPQHYPEDTPINHQARLQVMPFVQEANCVNDPTFSI